MMTIFDSVDRIGQFPRPDFLREKWEELNGTWDFDFDDQNVGAVEKWFLAHRYERKIEVPFCYQCERSGIHDTGYHPYIWYHKQVTLTEIRGSILLHFGAVDYHAQVWINGVYIGEHSGGHTPFCFDISGDVRIGTNEITVRVEDTDSLEQPRGKQVWDTKPDRCWYTATSGIWQTVWLEFTGKNYFTSIHITPDIDNRCAEICAEWAGADGEVDIGCIIRYQNKIVNKTNAAGCRNHIRFVLPIRAEDAVDETHYWDPDYPNLYDVEMRITGEDAGEDAVQTYFGMRKISIDNGVVLLNNKPLYQKLVLDQGYWKTSLLTPPDQEALKKDVTLIKALGFNGARKHQKIEDPRFYYWADVLGVLVWEEMPSCYQFSEKAVCNCMAEWREAITRDYNHPCIIVRVPLNESWGTRDIYSSVQQQNYAAALYYLTKTLDPGRLVSTNDGWEQVEQSDLCAIHDYTIRKDSLNRGYSDFPELLKKDAQGRMLYAQNQRRQDQPILITEFGGLAMGVQEDGWGYNKDILNEEAIIQEYAGMIEAIRSVDRVQGYCYTQLTDVMQEKNGLLDHMHEPKLSVEKIAQINRE